MHVEIEHISAGCNCTYNCLELATDFVLYGANNALAVYDLQAEKVIHTLVAHKGRINCVRFLSNTSNLRQWVVTCGSDGGLTLWKARTHSVGNDDFNNFLYEPKIVENIYDVSITVCDGIQTSESEFLVACITSYSKVLIYSVDREAGKMQLIQELNLNKSVALDLVFHCLHDDSNKIVLAIGIDSGSVDLYGRNSSSGNDECVFSLICTLNKHEDWVRCITFIKLDNGDTLMASGGEDSYIAVWRFTRTKPDSNEFEFQVHQFEDHTIVFDSMIIGHEGWINSLHWNSKGELLSCSSDQSTIIWQNLGDIWIEKARFGVIGGQIPGGFGAKFCGDVVVCWGFQGAIQIWTYTEDQWQVRPSVTGHFGPVSDLDYHLAGYYVVTTSEDQTTRMHSPWGLNRWHEIARPQIHGHNLFAVKTIGNMLVSGAEEKILRAFQPTEIFVQNLEEISEITADIKEVAPSASLPALGLSNQSEDTSVATSLADKPVEMRLDEDFLRSQTLWPEVSKLYGHVYEISCIATSPTDALIASASQSSKPQFSAIILWCSTRWKNLGEFPFHKLNVTDMEFSPDGQRLLSVSRDRTWAVWIVVPVSRVDDSETNFSIEVLTSGSFHTRALWVGSWAPTGSYFVTGARDKKLAIWKPKDDTKFETDIVQSFETSVCAAAVNSDGIIAVGLESGQIHFYQYNPDSVEKDQKLKLLLKLDNSLAHHDSVKRIKFNPAEKYQLASAGADHLVKVYQITPPP